MEDEMEYRALLAVDIERSAGRGNMALRQIRETLSAALSASFERSGIGWEECLREDLGDGLRVTAPAGVPKNRLIHPLVHELGARLSAHNRLAGPLTRVRVRIALHAGSVSFSRDGRPVGQPLEELSRLLDARPLRAALRAAPGDVCTALLASRHFWEETVRHGYPGIDPASFREVTVAEKEYAASAWLHLPGGAGSAPAAREEPRRETGDNGEPRRETGDSGTEHERPSAQPARMTNKAYGHGAVYATQHGSQTVNINPRP